MLIGQFFLQEDSAPQHGSHAVGADNRRGEGNMRGIGKRVDIEELTDRFEDGAGKFRNFHLEYGLLLFDQISIDRGADAGKQECQFVGGVGRILNKLFTVPEQKPESRFVRNGVIEQDEAVGKRSERV